MRVVVAASQLESSTIISEIEMLQHERSDVSSRSQSLRILPTSRGGSALRSVPSVSTPCIWGQFKQVKVRIRSLYIELHETNDF